jgi:RND family efflux transporter MFP subunit
MKALFSNFAALIVLTIGCAIVMVTVSLGVGWPPFLTVANEGKRSIEIPKMPVAVLTAQPRMVEVISSYTGMIRPFERYALGFEISGRLEALGTNEQGKPLDQGDRVKAGQVIARLDDRLLVAQLKESKARLEQAQTDMNRATELRAKGQRIITDAEFQNFVTQLQLAEAACDMAEKRLADATLFAPVSGKISRRSAKAGESVSAHQTILEIIEVDRVLLVLGVPESQVGEISAGQAVHVDLLARDKFGERLPGAEGIVYRVSETADDKTGLFEVEVEIDNAQDRLRPGLVATGRIVVDKMQGFLLPVSCGVQRDGGMHLFTVSDEGTAQAFPLSRWIEQGEYILVPELPPERRRVVVRGQHRLVDGRAVIVTPVPPDDKTELHAELPASESPGT